MIVQCVVVDFVVIFEFFVEHFFKFTNTVGDTFFVVVGCGIVVAGRIGGVPNVEAAPERL
jgi:hypothetical protein